MELTGVVTRSVLKRTPSGEGRTTAPAPVCQLLPKHHRDRVLAML
jgi:hypothetical protein